MLKIVDFPNISLLLLLNIIFQETTQLKNRFGKKSIIFVNINDDVFIVVGSVLLPGETIGPLTIIGASNVVKRDISDCAIAFGNPAIVNRYEC